jgi:hypothetical protein
MTRHGRAALLCALLALLAASSAGSAGSATTPRRSWSVQDSPGYHPPADPESASVRLGRRVNAPRVGKPFNGGGSSLADLGRRICGILENTPRLDSLMALAVTEDEFREVMWQEFPQSRPATGLRSEDGWRVLYLRLLNGCNSALVNHAGGYYEFLRAETDSVMQYRNFKLHSGVTLVARDAQGEEVRMNWLRAVAEQNGRVKIYSVGD